ncbi:VCBS repeat-containing protein [Bradyrhizobium lablabi]|uniref:Calx-beta domain-containing protein n=1 Tax=Bradyrhizobium lablabi TaxID=722472 RepID=UPI001BA87FCC|nr:Calx-beta domain-containing protein [Bradyrhizobium lablabi]MBR1122684.1 VCBS repeat-containing protein [Bradyrhizobium lablabi]
MIAFSGRMRSAFHGDTSGAGYFADDALLDAFWIRRLDSTSSPLPTTEFGHLSASASSADAGVIDDAVVNAIQIGTDFVVSGNRWTHNVITWSFETANYPAQQQGVNFAYSFPEGSNEANFIAQAFSMWDAAATNLTFQQVEDGPNVDIRIGWGENLPNDPGYNTLGMTYPFVSGTHPFTAANDIYNTLTQALILIDWADEYSDLPGGTSANKPFLNVVLHEIGHAIGLDHYDVASAVMNTLANNLTSLTSHEVNGVNYLYPTGGGGGGSGGDYRPTITSAGTISASAGQIITINYQVANIGNQSANTMEWRIYLSQDQLISVSNEVVDRHVGTGYILQPLAAGASVTGSYNIALPNDISGTWYLGIVADYGNFVVEANENNNISNLVQINVGAGGTAGSISINDVNISEGNSGTSIATFTVTRTGGTAAFSVNYTTANGTAIAGADYSANSGTLNFAAGVNSQTISVPVFGDVGVEGNETFVVNLSGATNGATIADGQGIGTIINDDAAAAAGSVSINDVMITEGNSGTPMATFTVTRTGGTAAFSVSYATANGSATAGGDYAADVGTLNFAAGVNSQTISIPIFGDAAVESNETFFVNLSNATNGATIADSQGIGTIANDDAAAAAGSVSINDVIITEGNSGTSMATFTVTRTGGTGAFSVSYATANGSAIAGADYSADTGTLNFAAGVNSQTISIPVFGDVAVENNETFVVNLSNATNGATIADGQGIGTIFTDDAISVAGSVSINDVMITEGNSGTSMATFTVTRTGGTGAFAVSYATANGTAIAGGDYAADAGTLSFAAGVNSRTVSIPIFGDLGVEANETFFVNLSGATNGATITDGQGAGTIANDDGSVSGDDYADSLSDATAPIGQLSIGGGVTGNLEALGDRDWFRVTLAAGTSYTFDLQGANSHSGTLDDPLLRLYDSSGNQVNSDDDSGTGYNPHLVVTPTVAGVYYIAAGAYNDGSAGTYRLSMATGANQPTPNDFDGDGRSDILWRNDAGAIQTWNMDGGTMASADSFGTVPSAWQVYSTDDFSGDGMSDMLWRNEANGTLQVWDIDDDGLLATHALGIIPANWHIIGTGDFNGDHYADILWRNDAGVVQLWNLNNSTLASVSNLGVIPNNWQVAATEDFNADGKTDILWRNSAGAVQTWDMNGGTVQAVHNLGVVPSNWQVVGAGDFNGDHYADILWQNDAGVVQLWDLNNSNLLASKNVGLLPSSWHIEATGDYSGDHMTDILLRNNAGVTAIWQMNDNNISSSDSLGQIPNSWHIIA